MPPPPTHTHTHTQANFVKQFSELIDPLSCYIRQASYLVQYQIYFNVSESRAVQLLSLRLPYLV